MNGYCHPSATLVPDKEPYGTQYATECSVGPEYSKPRREEKISCLCQESKAGPPALNTSVCGLKISRLFKERTLISSLLKEFWWQRGQFADS